MYDGQKKLPFFQILIGFAVIIFGILLILDNFDIMHVGDVMRYWPVIMIVYGLYRLFGPDQRGGAVFNSILVFVGVMLLLDEISVFYFSIWNLWPLLFILLGVSLILRAVEKKKPEAANAFNRPDGSPGVAESAMSVYSFMSGHRYANNSQSFSGGKITTIIGGADVDLRRATMHGDEAVIDVFLCIGGINIFVPIDWMVIVRCTPIIGACENKTIPPASVGSKRLVINGTAIIGGLKIRN